MAAGTTILQSRYRLDREVGKGGFARVYLGTDLILERRVAIKVLNPDLAQGGDFLARFKREAQRIAALDHPNILQIFDYGQDNAAAFLIMPFVEGGTLHEQLRQIGQPSPGLVATWLRQMAVALDYAHRRGVIHRDIKPENMLLRADGHLYLADFGIAKVLDETLTNTRHITGTVAYMAPERFKGLADSRSDVYALGCVLFQMLAGRTPYVGSMEEIIYGHLAAPVPALPSTDAAGLASGIARVVARALDKVADNRYQSAGELSAAFAAAVAGTAATVAAPVVPIGDDDAPTLVLASPPAAAPVPTIPMRAVSLDPVPRSGTQGTAPAVVGILAERARLRAEADTIASLVWSPTGQRLVAITTGHTARLWTATGREHGPLTGAVHEASWSPDGEVLITTTDLGPAQLRAPDGTAVATLLGLDGYVKAVAWAPDGRTFVVVAEEGPALLHAPDGTPARSLDGRYDRWSSFAWSPDGGVLATIARDDIARLWTWDGLPLRALDEHHGPAHTVSWSPDGRALITIAGDDVARLWTREGRLVGVLPGSVDSAAWSPTGQFLATTAGLRPPQVRGADGVPRATLEGHAAPVDRVAWSPDGRLLATISEAARELGLWRADGVRQTLRPGTACGPKMPIWSPDGGTIVAYSPGEDRPVLLGGADGDLRAMLDDHAGAIRAAAWSPDSRVLALATDDGSARLWALSR